MTSEEVKSAIDEMAAILEAVTREVTRLLKYEVHVTEEARRQVVREADALMARASALKNTLSPRTRDS